MRQATIMFDVDGVLADFVEAFTHTAQSFYEHAKVISAVDQLTWADAGGVSLWDDKVWEHLKAVDWWWTGLPPLVGIDVGMRIANLNLRIPTFFVTNRMHYKTPAAVQTAAWLRDRLGITLASVITTKHKAAMADMLKATHFLEDNIDNAMSIAALSDCKSYLLDRKYNQGPTTGVIRVASVHEFLDIVEKEVGDGFVNAADARELPPSIDRSRTSGCGCVAKG